VWSREVACGTQTRFKPITLFVVDTLANSFTRVILVLFIYL